MVFLIISLTVQLPSNLNSVYSYDLIKNRTGLSLFLNESDVQGEVCSQSKSVFLPLARLLSSQVTGILDT